MPVDARRFLRKMRGGAQAHLLEAEDGHAYVVKFLNNPQHRRILVNELVSSVIAEHLGLPTPAYQLIRVTDEFLEKNSEVAMETGHSIVRPTAGWHFGSRFPGDPQTQTVYDFIPDTLLEKVANLSDFLGAFVFDKWLSNADSRQAIFYRARVEQRTPDGWRERPAFVAMMIDHGYVFDGPHWTFIDSAIQGLYFRTVVYSRVRSLDSFEPWLSRVRDFPVEVIDTALKRVPSEWLGGDRSLLEQMLERLMRRRSRVTDLIEEAKAGRSKPFPNWT
jgi:hypothetical protein